jgi:hypothetical protein
MKIYNQNNPGLSNHIELAFPPQYLPLWFAASIISIVATEKLFSNFHS